MISPTAREDQQGRSGGTGEIFGCAAEQEPVQRAVAARAGHEEVDFVGEREQLAW